MIRPPGHLVVRHDRLHAERACDRGRLVERADHVVALVAHVGCEHAAQLGQRGADVDHLLRGGVRRRRIEGAGGDAVEAGAQCLLRQRAHRCDLVGCGRPVGAAHHAGAQRRVAEQWSAVHRGRRVAQCVDELAAAVQARPARRRQQVQRLGQLAVGQRGQAHAAIAADAGGHALGDLASHVGLDQQRQVVVRMRVDEAGCHDSAARVDLLAAAGQPAADFGHAAGGDGHVGRSPGRAAAVDQRAVADDEVEHVALLSAGAIRRATRRTRPAVS